MPYRAYIACLNRRDWIWLGDFVATDARHNVSPLGLSGYRAMPEQHHRDIPELRFDRAPAGMFMGLAVNGRRLSFTGNVFYRFRDGRIAEVWSVIDKTAIEAQLG